ncbi:auxin-responsive protein SAUR50 [Juglans microcarpa x Juglans regia]|uniref:auxin-responsive protein SAUR50 n=1 Tax=Juglans microcarpa x Juglans regia TaxID=2249226 RepID=UPI001B7E2C46|nr:auxin-responsive protein SAUR50 [Juglans microcarpa x Juglans regia]
MAAKPRTNGKKKNGIVKLKIVVEKLQRSLSLVKKSSSNCDKYDINSDMPVPEDVKEGHFVVNAVEGDEPRRFVVPLSYLTHPTFVRLLEKAAEEYGFDHEGALTVPCRPSELERILAEQWQEQAEGGSDHHDHVGVVHWGS